MAPKEQPMPNHMAWWFEPMSEKQKDYLGWLGYQGDMSLTKKDAQRIIQQLKEEKKAKK